MRWSAVIVVAAVAVLASGCLGSSSSGSSGTTAAAATYGIVVCVVAAEQGGHRLGEDAAELDPVPATDVLITGRTTAGARVVRRSRTDANGDFRLRLPTGRYTFSAKVGPSKTVLRRRARVRPGETTTVWIARYLSTFLTTYAL